MNHQALRLVASRAAAVVGLVYLYTLDAPGSLLARFNQPDKFERFLLLNAGHAILMCALIWFIGRLHRGEPRSRLRLAGWLMFLNGAVFNFAYAMGPPPRDDALFAAPFREEIRFSFLIAAATLATAGILTFLLRRNAPPRVPGRVVTASLILVGYGLFLWTEVSYYIIRPRLLHDLLMRGLPLDNQVGQASVAAEALGRLCFYWGVPLVLAIGVREKTVSRLAAIIMGVLSTAAGYGILHAAFQRPPASLMPFTIPAFVLMPTYWLGILLLAGRGITKPRVGSPEANVASQLTSQNLSHRVRLYGTCTTH